MTRRRDPSTPPWFRQHDVDAHHALRQAGVLPWEPPLEHEALVDYHTGRWFDMSLVFGNLPRDDESRRLAEKAYYDWLRITVRRIVP